jgi:hypothetical protein
VFWLCSVCAVVWFAVALPWQLRGIACCAAIAANLPAIRRCVLLRGGASVQALEWREQGGLAAALGHARVASPATLAAGSFRLGGLMFLRLQTAGGMRAVLIDGGRQEIRAFRRLSRYVSHAGRGAGHALRGVREGIADTIPPKV